MGFHCIFFIYEQNRWKADSFTKHMLCSKIVCFGKIFTVHYYENDGMQVVHHANYVHWLEEARVEYLREGGILLNDLTAAGIVCPILEVNIKYISSARNDDVVLVKTCALFQV